ncbi:MAG: ATP-dependent Clp protease adapter ClpS [Spirochaetales bacterium]|nr:ATP-dependent Clp protease adapter ClpS [Spirochaetales bacterium]MCF7937052.1 ATP-dependent Clp protease adapter ClpS [Spirochaetales bacterium]
MDDWESPDGEVLSEDEQKVDEPGMYKVVLHNDDYTTMDFVVEILTSIFKKSFEEATEIMFNVHTNGKGVAGVYTYDIAATKARQVRGKARQSDFPLKCSLEEA